MKQHCLNMILLTWDMFCIFSLWLKAQHFYFNTLLKKEFQTISNKEAILWNSTLKELFSVNSLKNISERVHFDHSYKLAIMLKMCCYRCFSKNLVKIYRAAILTNSFKCMWSKSLWSTHPVVFFNPLMLVVTMTYILKQTWKS